MAHLRFPVLVACFTLFAACGGTVLVDTGGGAGGAGGSGGGTTSKACGGKQGTPCGADEWCQWSPAGSCGNFDNAGVCQPKPQACPPDCPGVCGCDGAFYCSACSANQAGLDVDPHDICGFDAGPGGDQYSAYVLATNLQRYAIFKAELSSDRCIQMIVAMSGSSSYPGIQTTMGWGVESVVITPHASDCALDGSGYPIITQQAYKANDAGGDLKQDSATFPTVVSLHVKLSFPQGPASWIPPGDTMDADDLPIFASGTGGP